MLSNRPCPFGAPPRPGVDEQLLCGAWESKVEIRLRSPISYAPMISFNPSITCSSSSTEMRPSFLPSRFTESVLIWRSEKDIAHSNL